MQQDNLVHITHELLKRQGHKVDYAGIELHILSHPDYPAVKAICDTLRDFDIEGMALNLTQEDCENLPRNFIAHVRTGQSEDFCLVSRVNTGRNKIILTDDVHYEISLDEFKKIWTGVVILAEEKNNANRPSINDTNTLLFLSLLLLPCFLFSSGYDHYIAYYTSVLGLGLAILAFLNESGQTNARLSKFCKFGKTGDCNHIINLKGPKIFNLFSLSDLSVVYFSTLAVSQVLAVHSDIHALLPWLSLTALPFVLYSVYVQVSARKWCLLCLGIDLILITQACINWAYAVKPVSQVSFLAAATLCMIALFVAVAWIKLSAMLRSIPELKALKIENSTFRRNYHLFLPYFDKLPEIKIPDTVKNMPFIQYKKNGIKLLLVLNPLCGHCRTMYSAIDSIQKKYGVFSAVYFVPYVRDWEHNSLDLLISLNAIDYFRKGGDLWESMFFKQKTDTLSPASLKPVSGFREADIRELKNIMHWCNYAGIGKTPAMIIENKVFPYFYHPEDIGNFVEELSCRTKVNSQNILITRNERVV